MSTTTRLNQNAMVSATKRLPRKTTRRGGSWVSLDGLLTVEEWDALPDTKPRYELINGKLVQKMTTRRRHSKAAGKFLVACDIWATEQNNGWQFFPEGTGVVAGTHNGFVPDVVGFPPDVQLDPDESVGGAPFIVVEVLSDSTAKKDRTTKKNGYAQAGVKIYILIDPDANEMEIYRAEEKVYGAPEVLRENEVWQPAELPGLRVELARLWM